MKTAKLKLERAKELLDYDPSTGIFRWRVDRVAGDKGQIIKGRAGDEAGTVAEGYRTICIDWTIYRAHRLAWFMVYGRWPKCMLDHVNGVRTDNRLENLREASVSENGRNRGRQSNNTSGFKGVSRDNRGKWRAQISIGKRRLYLGSYVKPEDAHAAYVAAAVLYYGQFARSE